MRQVAVGALLGLGLAVSLLGAACAPSPTPAGPTPRVGTPIAPTVRAATPALGVATARAATPGTPAATARAGTPTAGTAIPRAATPGVVGVGTPTAEVRGVQATAPAGGTVGPAMAQMLMRDMDQFRDQLRQWSSGTPTVGDLMAMTQRANVLMNDLRQQLPQMTMQEREQALARMSDVLGDMAQVVQTRVRQLSAMGTPVGTVVAERVMTMTAASPTPVGMATPASVAQQLMAQIDQLRNRMMQLENGKPTYADTVELINRLQGAVMATRQQASQLSDQELEGLTGDLTNATDDMVGVMRTLIQEETGSAPTFAPSSTMMP